MNEATFSTDSVGKFLDIDVLDKVQHRDPAFLLGLFNPRVWVEYEVQTIIPKIVATKGKITKALVTWQPSPDHPCWESGEVKDPMTNEPVIIPLADRGKFAFIVQGHRRTVGALEIRSQPDTYSSTTIENLRKLPCIAIEGSQEDVEAVALDDEGARSLYSWNTVKIIMKKLAHDVPWRVIATEMPQLAYTALLKSGAVRYDEVSRIQDGAERATTIKTDLRNPMENWLLSAHLFGQSAFVDHLILHFRYAENRRPDAGDQKLLLLDLKYQKVMAMRKLYTKLTKTEGKRWRQITKIAIEPAPEKGEHTSCQECPGGHGYFVVIGGLPEFRDHLLREMRLKAAPEEKKKGPKAPNKTDRDNVESGTLSNVGRATAQFLNNGISTIIEDRTRSEWDANAAHLEAIQKGLSELTDLTPLVKAAVDAVVLSGHAEVTVQKALLAFETLNNALKPVKAKK